MTALARDLNRIEIQHERLRVIEGNVLNENDIKAIEGSDIVISALGTDQNGTLAKEYATNYKRKWKKMGFAGS